MSDKHCPLKPDPQPISSKKDGWSSGNAKSSKALSASLVWTSIIWLLKIARNITQLIIIN